MTAKTLHIVDGESAGGTLKQAGLAKSKDILCWRDALYSGPVPAGLSLRELSRLRSRYWTAGRSSTQFDRRDAALAKQAEYEHITLWFGPGCALCQLSLVQILSWFRERGVAAEHLSWVRVHGGTLPPQQMVSAYEKRQPITPAQITLAEYTWRCYRQDSPVGLARLLRRDLNIFPGLKRALIWLLQEYPSRSNGLSRLEGRLLRQFHRRQGTRTSRAVAHVLARDWVGDVLLFDMLRNFVRAAHPLLRFSEPFAGNVESHKFNRAALALTEDGQRVLAGKIDAIALNGIDRWIGGVHLHGSSVRWRWDGREGRVVRTQT